MKFETKKGNFQWYEGTIVSYNGQNMKYGVYFLYDGETVETSLDDEDMEF